MKLSTTNTLCDGPTLRQKAVGMPGGSTRVYSTRLLGSEYARLIAASVVSPSVPFWKTGGIHRAMTEEPAKRCVQAIGLPLPSSTRDKGAYQKGRYMSGWV